MTLFYFQSFFSCVAFVAQPNCIADCFKVNREFSMSIDIYDSSRMTLMALTENCKHFFFPKLIPLKNSKQHQHSTVLFRAATVCLAPSVPTTSEEKKRS